MFAYRPLVAFGAVSAALLAVGCGRDGPEVVPVTGTLTYKGKAIPNALVHFLPENGRQSWARTDAEGKFKVHYDRHQDGAVVGKHKVWIEYKAATPEEEDAIPEGKAAGMKGLRDVFARYGYEKSKLEVQITSDSREIPIKLE